MMTLYRTWIALLSTAVVLQVSCRQDLQNTLNISGQAQGTTYQITYVASQHSNFRAAFDSIFTAIDQSLSTYVPGSLISRINRNDGSPTVDAHFREVFNKAMEVSANTNGLFDVTVGPLINAYGFGPAKKQKLEPGQVDSLLQFIGYQKVQLDNNKLIKSVPGVKLDFNAIAQGYTVDLIAAFLDSKGIRNYLVELGGEVRAKGKKLDGSPWSVGIEQPNEYPEQGKALHTKVDLLDKALATSGNYKKFYVEDGKKYTHIIDPLTGTPAKNNLLSATVVAADCMTADAYATAFMVMGLERARTFLEVHPELGLKVLLIYDQNGEWKSYSSL
jgi:thiamine biosynthesis lipoprotein